MPMVMNIARVEQAIKMRVRMPSTWLRARRAGVMRRRTRKAAAITSAIVVTARAAWLMVIRLR